MKKPTNQNKISSTIKFLIIVLLIYLGFAIFNFSIAEEAFLNFWEMFKKIILVLVLVFGIMLLVNYYFNKNRIRKYLGEKSGFMGCFYAMIAGIIISGPAYIFFPLLKEMKERRMKDSISAAFLYSKNIKIPFLPVMVYYFGLSFTVILTFYTIVFSVLNGKLVGWLIKRN